MHYSLGIVCLTFRLAVTLDSLRSKELEQADKVEELCVQLNDFKADEKLYKLENIALRQQLVCTLVI